MRKASKPSSSRPISIYFEFRSKPSLITVICMNPHSPDKLIATKYCFLILGDDTSFFFLTRFLNFFFFFVILCYFVIINFYKNCYYFYFILLIFFHENFFYFFMFQDVPGCSGMFRNVPECSVFWVLSTPYRSCLRAVRRLLFPSLHAEKGRLRNTVANCVPAPRWRGILFRINHE